MLSNGSSFFFLFGLTQQRKLFSEGQIVWIIYCCQTAQMCLWTEVSSDDISPNDKLFNPHSQGSINDRHHTNTHTHTHIYFTNSKKLKLFDMVGWLVGSTLGAWQNDSLFNCYYCTKFVAHFPKANQFAMATTTGHGTLILTKLSIFIYFFSFSVDGESLLEFGNFHKLSAQHDRFDEFTLAECPSSSECSLNMRRKNDLPVVAFLTKSNEGNDEYYEIMYRLQTQRWSPIIVAKYFKWFNEDENRMDGR